MSARSGIRHIVWDWNGTLLDDTELCIDVMNGLLAERGLPLLDSARYREIFDFPVVEYYRRLGFDFDRDPFHIIGAEFIRRYEARRAEARLHPQALETLAALREAGYAQSILSAYKQDTLESLLLHFGIRAYFNDVIGADNVFAHGKLDQGRAWIRRQSIEPGAIVLIGDTRHDHDVAQAMQCQCLLVANGYHSRAKLKSSGARVLDNLADVRAILVR